MKNEEFDSFFEKVKTANVGKMFREYKKENPTWQDVVKSHLKILREAEKARADEKRK